MHCLTAAAAAARSRSCPSSPLQQQQQKSSRLCTPPTSGRSTPVPPLQLPPLALPRAAAALAALSIEVPTTAEAARESAAAPVSTSRVPAPPKDPIEAENEALAEFVSWLIANGVSGLSEHDARVGIYAEPVETGSGSGSNGNNGSSVASSTSTVSSEPASQQLNRGVLALRDFAAGEELFRVPLRLAITDHIVNGSAAAAAAGEDNKGEAAAGRSHRAEPSAWGARLTCRLLREKARGRASPWAPWLSVLPTTTTTTTTARAKAKPTAAPGEEEEASGETAVVVVRPGSLRSAWAGALPREVAALLPCPAASRALLAATTAADAEFAKLPKAALASALGAAAASSSPPSPLGSDSPCDGGDDEAKASAAMAAYRWARAVVQSRTFGSTAKEEERSGGADDAGDGDGAPPPPVSLVRMLVPLADFVNHAGDETEGASASGGRAAPTANAEWKIVADYNSSDEDECALDGGGEGARRAGAAAGGARGRGARPGRGGGFGGVAEGRPPREAQLSSSPSSSSSAAAAAAAAGCAPPPATSWSLVVSAARPLVAGEEVSFSYGNRVNADFLVSYGFVPARNPHDAVCLFESAEEAAGWAARRLLGSEDDEGGGGGSSPSPLAPRAVVAAAVAAAERETPPSLARAISSSRDPEIVAEARRLWLWAGGRVDERLAAALESVCLSSSSASSPSAAAAVAAAGELVAARAAELLARSGAPPLSDALGELERAGEHEHEEQHYFRALKRRYAAKEAAVRRSAARASQGAAAALSPAVAPPPAVVAPAAPLPPPPPRGASRSTWRSVRLMALRAGVYSTMILWDALEAADKAFAAAKEVETAG